MGAIAALFVASPALADARTEARAHFKRGMEAIGQQKYADGIAELEQAYAILPNANVLYNIGKAHEAAGELEKAIEYYKRYVDENPPDKADVLANIKALEAKLKTPEPVTPVTPVAPTEPAPPPPVTPAPQTKTEDVFAESVVTASKTAQSPLDAASSTSVITEQDIRLSGITKIPELLRRLAGVDIMEVTGGQTEVSIRGFNQRLSNKTLVLVDGRSVYADILGATIWQTLSVGVEDIERIEIVRGPGSSSYGADAFNGVINIITKKPGEGKNGIAGGYGSQATTHGSLWASGREGELGWRMAAGYDYLPRWSREVPNGRADVTTGVGDQVESARTIRLDARGSRTFGKIGTLSFGGGLAQGSDEILGIGTLTDIVLPTLTSTDLTTSWESEHIDARVFWNRLRAESTLNVNYVGQSLLPSRIEQNVVDGEAVYKTQFKLNEGATNDLRVGGGYRYKNVQWSYLDHDRFEHHYSLFLHDQLTLGRYLAFAADYRIDWVPYLESFEQSPRGAVLVHPTKLSTVRASVATGYRKPTFLESYLRLPIQLPITGAAENTDGVRRDDSTFILQPEHIFSAEIGYSSQDSDVVSVDAAVYFNRVSQLIQLSSNRPITVADFPVAGKQDQATGFYPAGFGGWENQCQAYRVFGGEVGVRTFPTEGLDVYGNYTLNLANQDNTDCTVEQLSRTVPDQRTSQHKFNGGVQLRTKAGFDAALDLHYVSVQYWAEQVTNFLRQQIEQEKFRLAGYALLNARVGYRFLADHAEVAIVAFNTLGSEHREHPFGQLLDRRVMLQFGYRF
jgi:iron complex outermembrane receptor protein